MLLIRLRPRQVRYLHSGTLLTKHMRRPGINQSSATATNTASAIRGVRSTTTIRREAGNIGPEAPL